MMDITLIDWKKIELVIFDVDGTLYNQSKLRKRMLFELIGYYIFRPWKYNDLLILYHYRKEREKRAGVIGNKLEQEQYLWCSAITGIGVAVIQKVVEKWIFEFPNKYLKSCRYPYVKEFFQILEHHHIKLAIYSDYEANRKMKALDLKVDLMVSSTDSQINAMKPQPNGLIYILNKLNVTAKTNCLFIGDRMELDGKCAENAQIPYLIIDPQHAKNNLYHSLSENLSDKIL